MNNSVKQGIPAGAEVICVLYKYNEWNESFIEIDFFYKTTNCKDSSN